MKKNNYNYKLPFLNHSRYIAMLMLFLLTGLNTYAQFNRGTGTPSDPYQIANVTQLQAMNTGLDKHYVLTQNIDASVTSTWNAGEGFEPIGLTTAAAFTGTFDGKGFVITKLYINENISYPFLRRPGAPCVNTTATDSIRACKSYTWINGITYTMSVDTASFIIPNAAGCDSIITLKLTIDTINTDVSLNANILSATESAAGTTYQWINCDTNKPIANATNQSYTVTLTGNYAVIISNGTCMDTSDCVTVTLVGFESNANHEWNVYPNPTSSKINFALKSTAQLTITDALGKIILENNLQMGKHQIDLSEYVNGVYILNLNDGTNTYRNRVVLNK